MSTSTKARSRKAIVTGAAFLAAGALVLSGCASSDDPAAEPEETQEAVTPGAGTEPDGTLAFGTVLPQTGSLAVLGPPEFAGVDLAIAEIQEYLAGVEAPFEVTVTHRDSGDNETDIASQSADELIGLGTDVIIGAASSGVSLNIINALVAAGVVQISPANTAGDFTTYEDGGYYWRTAPSDVIQGDALANLIVNNGGQRLGIIYLNDAYGAGLAEYTSEPFEGLGGEVVASVTYNASETSFQSQVDDIINAGADSIAVIGFEESRAILPILIDNESFPADSIYLVDGNLANFGDDVSANVEGMWGTLPGNPADSDFQTRLLAVDPELEDFSYAAEAYDAVVLATLAALQGGDDGSATIKDNLQSVSEGGTKCTSFAECAALIAAGEDIDYDGPSGPVEWDSVGDPTAAYVGIYQYGPDNTYTQAGEPVFGSIG